MSVSPSAGYRWEGSALIVRLRARPRAGRDRWDGPVADRFQVHIAAPPVDGEANAHLRDFLATLFGVAKSQVTLLAGETGRDKRVRIADPRRLPPGIAPAPAPQPQRAP